MSITFPVPSFLQECLTEVHLQTSLTVEPKKLKVYTLEEFVNLTDSDPDSWKNYCEILLLPNGKIILARPSHQEAALEYGARLEHESIEDVRNFMHRELMSPLEFFVSKYNIISLWYNYMLKSASHDLIDAQKATLDHLKSVGLIDSNMRIEETSEYAKFLYRKSLVAESL